MDWSLLVKLIRGRWTKDERRKTKDERRWTMNPGLAEDGRLSNNRLSSFVRRLSSFVLRPSSFVHRPSIWSVPVGLQLSVIYALLLAVTLALLGTFLYIW